MNAARPAEEIILVLGAKLRPDGTPTPALERRARFAARLAIERGARLICSGGAVGAPIAEATVMAGIAEDVGLSQHRIVVEDQARNTWENVALAIPLIPAGAGLIVVTDPSHGLRARMVARRQGLTPQMALTWGAQPRSRMRTVLMLWLRETVALAVYWWRYRGR